MSAKGRFFSVRAILSKVTYVVNGSIKTEFLSVAYTKNTLFSKKVLRIRSFASQSNT